MSLPRPYYQEDGITLYHGDCRDILPVLERESVTLLWTDPPYGHANMAGDLQSARVGIKGARQALAAPIANDSAEDMREVVDVALRLSVPLLRPDCCCCCCCCCCGGGGPRPTFAWVADRMDRDGLTFFHANIWDKRKRGPGWVGGSGGTTRWSWSRIGPAASWRGLTLTAPSPTSTAPPPSPSASTRTKSRNR